ncbi:uncharacterized protein EI97DRAFT_432325 [Westerdykella ornata]|uniref:Splicing factor U2AF subunit n=1 Tax=Westerdykella ornata TaxID=318751 RepID=A0A6A6JLB5_WESOR|nr:uncharacterized protein EI97DRAFT_432325 [Westerdykella ornata]KAF2277450.1 hypothetical protein EI97DRAFT_432325 [Westerdykella ornata]
MSGDTYSRDGGRQSGARNYSSRDDDRDRRRRRSRSPRHGSRRDYEVDTYSSSRDYREREREDTYARRERREDRAWGDSYSRRDHPRRDDDRGYGRREREGHDDRSNHGDRRERGDRDLDRGGRGRRGDRDRDGGFGGGFGGRDRKKSQSPPYKKREPTPDLTNVVSILQRPRRMTQWDIKPAGYENITAEQAKLSGMFPLPGAPRAAPMDPSKLAAFMAPAAGSASASALKPENAKQAKRLLVYNLPANISEDLIVGFFNLQLNGLNVVSGDNPCLSAHVSKNRDYALLEFKAPEDATMALALDGIQMDEDAGDPDRPGLSIRRPKDYIAPLSSSESDQTEDGASSIVKDSPNKLSISNIPPFVEDAQIRELLEAFGELKSFVVVKEIGSELNRGIAFCEYVNQDTVDAVIEGLNTIALGDKNLKVQRASVGVSQDATLDGGVSAISMLAGSKSNGPPEAGRVLVLMNMVTHDELLDKDSYEEIKEEVEEECSKYGRILEVKIPRPSGARVNPGVGKIYIKYETPESAQKAIKALAGRAFTGRTVVVTHFSEELFDVDAW